MSFSGDIAKFAEKVRGNLVEIVTEGGVEVQRSVVEGSELTGAPGQPVDTGFLKGSFIPERVSDLEWQTTTNVAYAPAIEEGVREAYDPRGVQRPPPRPEEEGGTRRKGPSEVGGPHSVALTRAAWQKIVDHAALKVVK